MGFSSLILNENKPFSFFALGFLVVLFVAARLAFFFGKATVFVFPSSRSATDCLRFRAGRLIGSVSITAFGFRAVRRVL